MMENHAEPPSTLGAAPTDTCAPLVEGSDGVE